MTSEHAGQLYDQYEDAIADGDAIHAHELFLALVANDKEIA